jgi:vacuolar-type H+-ATPase subunit B/Vma2
LAFCFGVCAETVTVTKDTSQLISVQVYGKCEGVNVASTVAIGERLIAETAAADSSVGRLNDTDEQIDSNAEADIEEMADAAVVGVALSDASSNTATVWLLDPFGLSS